MSPPPENVGDYALEHRLQTNRAFGKLDLTAIMIERLDLWPRQSVLDVGCGNGRFTLEYKRGVEAGSVVGIDQSETLIEDAIKTSAEQGLAIDFKVMDACDLDLPTNGFDRVACSYAVYHFPDVAKGLSEMLRVAADDHGKIVLSGPAADNNAELYDALSLSGGRVNVEMGREVFERETGNFLRETNLPHRYTTYDNPVEFPSITDFLEYFQTTKLFLENTPQYGQDIALLRLKNVLTDRGIERPTVTKRVGVYEAWN